MASDSNQQGDRIELTPDEARMVIKAIEEVEREEAEAMDVAADDCE